MSANEKKTPGWIASRALAEQISKDLQAVLDNAAIMKRAFPGEEAIANLSQEFQAQQAIAEAMRSPAVEAAAKLEEFNKMAEALQPLSDIEKRFAMPKADDLLVKPEPVAPLPRLPPIEETPHGRTMLAVEELQKSGRRVEVVINAIAGQAGGVSKLIANVITEIRDTGQRFQAQSEEQTRKALRFAKWSIVISVAALAFTAVFSGYNVLMTRAQGQAADRNAAIMLEQAQQENAKLQSLVQELRQQREGAMAEGTGKKNSPRPGN